VAFAVGERLLKASLQAGRPVELCRFSGGEFSGGSWSAEQGIVFTVSRANWDGDVLRVPENGGKPEVWRRADPARGERRLYQPHFLPDGRTLLFSVVTREANDGEIVVDRDGQRSSLGLGNGAEQAAWSDSGHVLFTRKAGLDQSLWALPFSARTLGPTANAFRVAASGTWPSAARGGTVVYAVPRRAPQQLVWVDRAGRQLGTISKPREESFWEPSISPDGRLVAANLNWERLSVFDAERGVETTVASPPELAYGGDWLPGGQEIVYSLLGGGVGIRARRTDGSGDARVLLDGLGGHMPSLNPEATLMAFYVVDPETARDLWAAPTDGSGEPFVLLRTDSNEAVPKVSPDGRFVAYQSDASGRWEVYIMPFPRGEGRWQVSVGGGEHPRWNPRGGELFFDTGDAIMVADVTLGSEPRIGTPRRLFGGEAVSTAFSLPGKIECFYAVAPDGRRFAIVKGVRQGTSDVVLADGALDHAEGSGEPSQ